MRLSRHLALLVCAAVTPIAVIALILAAILAMQERKQVEASLERLSLEFSGAFDRELEEIIANLVATTASNLPLQGDMRAVYERALKVQAENKNWVATALIELPGRMIFDTTLPFGAEPAAGDLKPLAIEASQTGRPAISPTLAKDIRAGEETLAIAWPISLSIDHEEPNHYAIGIRYRAVALSNVFGAVAVPPQWTVDLIDAAGTLIARSGAAGGFTGEQATPEPVRRAAG